METRANLGRVGHLLAALLLAFLGGLHKAKAEPVPGVERATAEATHRVLSEGQLPEDRRLGELRHLNSHFPFQVPKSLDDWKQRREQIRRRVQFANGLWPMPKLPEPQAVVHGKVQREDYTVERVYLESYPGYYVTGSLYRPVGKSGPFPAVLCPYGHWGGGRFGEHSEEVVKRQIAAGAERYEVGGRSPLQARCVQLARMGCVVFLIDLAGYCDSQQVGSAVIHGLRQPRPEFEEPTEWGFYSTQAELRMVHPLGLQTYNSLCAFDWLASLSEVDPSRMGVTGGSGGATQTLMLGALEDRVASAFAVVMVSTVMQGGCTCENACALRVGVGNVDFAALFAPKPLGMASANDWTRDFHHDGYPELQSLYAMHDASENVKLAALTHFPHNYNYVSRSHMYDWFNQHLQLGNKSPIVEQDFVPFTEQELTVWDAEHPAPRTDESYERELVVKMAQVNSRPIEFEVSSSNDFKELQRVVCGALQVALGEPQQAAKDIAFAEKNKIEQQHYDEILGLVTSAKQGTELPTTILMPNEWNSEFVLWAHGDGKKSLWNDAGAPAGEVQRLLDGGFAVVAADLFQQGEFLLDDSKTAPVQTVDENRPFAPYTFGYNLTLFSHRTTDLLALVSCFSEWKEPRHSVHLLAVEGAGPWAIAARALAGKSVETAAIDTQGFRFARLKSWKDENFLPGAVKYGDLPAMMAMSAPLPLYVTGESSLPEIVTSAYRATGQQDHVELIAKSNVDTVDQLVDVLLQQATDTPD